LQLYPLITLSKWQFFRSIDRAIYDMYCAGSVDVRCSRQLLQ